MLFSGKGFRNVRTNNTNRREKRTDAPKTAAREKQEEVRKEKTVITSRRRNELRPIPERP